MSSESAILLYRRTTVFGSSKLKSFIFKCDLLQKIPTASPPANKTKQNHTKTPNHNKTKHQKDRRAQLLTPHPTTEMNSNDLNTEPDLFWFWD